MSLEERVSSSLDVLGVGATDTLAIACSGGADSIALVHLLAGRSPKPVVLHVDHGLRADSHEDADFVREIAQRLDLPFAQRRVDVTKQDGSLEAGARRARYAALEEMAGDTGARFVATAHTLDDQAETVLLRLMRGATLDAIAPSRGRIVRPLLGIRRAELRDWLRANDISWREDPTNTDERFERNWVRAQVLPRMEERRPGVAATLARSAELERLDHQALDAFADDVFARAAIDDVGVFLSRSELDLVPPAIGSRVIRRAFRCLGSDPTHEIVESTRTLTTSRLRIGGVDVWGLPDGLAFVRQPLEPPAPVDLPVAGDVEASMWGLKVRVGPPSAAPRPWRFAVPDDASVLLRSRRPGDRVRTRAGTKKVQDVLVDARVPRVLRDLVPILEVDGSARAVVGLAVSGRAPVDPGRVVDVEPMGQTWSRERAWVGT